MCGGDFGVSEERYRNVGKVPRVFEGSLNCSERSSRAAGIKYIGIILINELILIIKGIYLKAIWGSNFLMGQISDLGPMRESAFWKDVFEAPRV